jgi:hypothetical protein
VAILFNGTSSTLTYSGTVPSDVPISMFCWIKVNSTGMTKTNIACGFGQWGATRLYRASVNGTADDRVRFQVNDGSGSQTLDSTLAVSQDTWMPMLVTHAGSTRRVYLGAGSRTETTDGASITWASANRFTVGFGPHAAEHYFAGEITKVCVWTSELTQSNFDSLAAYADPSTIDSGNIWDYWSLATNGGTLTGINGRDLVAANTSQGGSEPGASPSSSIAALMYHHSRRRA